MTKNTPVPPLVEGCRWLPLSKGLFALVDESEYEWASRFNWTAMIMPRTQYAYYRRRMDGKYPMFLLHRLIMNAPPKLQVDHINGDGLDCRRENMRVCTVQENHQNIRKSAGCSSQFKGVTWDKNRNLWLAKVKTNGRHQNLGRFASEEEAARAYDRAANELFGEFARLNFPCK